MLLLLLLLKYGILLRSTTLQYCTGTSTSTCTGATVRVAEWQ
jgi:hypothetical protein